MPSQIITMRQILKFVNPPDMYHTPSLYYLRLLAQYGPPVENQLVNTQGRPLTKYEIRPMLEIYEQETEKIVGKAGYRHIVHPKNLEILHFIEHSLIALKRKRGDYKPGFTLDTEVHFDDFSQAVDLNYEKFVLKICK